MASERSIEIKPRSMDEAAIRAYVRHHRLVNRTALKLHNERIYRRALRAFPGLLENIFGHYAKTPASPSKWTAESIARFVHDHCITTRWDLQKASEGAYRAGLARHPDLLNDLFPK